jgi:hypothetical protein
MCLAFDVTSRDDIVPFLTAFLFEFTRTLSIVAARLKPVAVTSARNIVKRESLSQMHITRCMLKSSKKISANFSEFGYIKVNVRCLYAEQSRPVSCTEELH